MKGIFALAILFLFIVFERPLLNAEDTTPRADATRPNVLMIAIDDLSDYVSVLQNHPGVKTPNFEHQFL